MRIQIALALLLTGFAISPAMAGDDKSDDKLAINKEPMTAKEVAKYFTPYVDAVAACYKQFGLKQKKATGEFQVELIILYTGRVKRVKIRAPGVRGKKLQTCVEKLAKDWHFPDRGSNTIAHIPFKILKTKGKGLGPYKTCWSAKGCPVKKSSKVKKDKDKDKPDKAKDKKTKDKQAKDKKPKDKQAKDKKPKKPDKKQKPKKKK